MQKVFNFSAGLTSAFMTILLWRPGDIVLNCDTGREHEKSYKFIDDFEINEGIPVTKIFLPDKWDGFLMKWNKGKSLPNRGMRECTLELKIRTARRWCRQNIGMMYENYIGFRADEEHRVKDHVEKWDLVTTRFPLYEMNFRKSNIQAFWEQKEYTLEIPQILGNCDLCFMKGKNNIIAILTNFPEMADKWIADEEHPANIHGHTYVKGVTMRQMRDAALELRSKGKIYDLRGLKSPFQCTCTSV